jgi:hypothetical protein
MAARPSTQFQRIDSLEQDVRDLRKKVEELRAKSMEGGGAHEIVAVYSGEKLVASFEIRRGSEKDKGHDHVQKELAVPTRFAKELALCTKSREHG